MKTKRRFVGHLWLVLVLLVHAPTYAQTLADVFRYGQQRGLATVHQQRFLAFCLQHWTSDQQTETLTFLKQVRSPLGQFLLLESVLAGEKEATLTPFVQALNRLTDSQMLDQCTVRRSRALIQQWENTCSITTVQLFLADLSPRYAYDLTRNTGYTTLLRNPANGIARQQQRLLEQYGGQAATRGDYTGGRTIGINDVLNRWVGGILRGSFRAETAPANATDLYAAIRRQLDVGINVPIRIEFVQSAGGHFMLVLDYKQQTDGVYYLLYDPYDGVCGYVSEATLNRGSVAPLNTSWQIRVSHYYPFVANG